MRNACTELFDDQQRLFYKHIHVHKLILHLHAYKMNYFRTMKLANTTLLNGSVLRYRAWNMRKLGAQASRGCSSISRERTSQVCFMGNAHYCAIFFFLQNYELRRYSPAKWVSYTVKSMKKKEAQTEGFWKLFNYIQGENEKGDLILSLACMHGTYEDWLEIHVHVAHLLL